MAMFRVSAVVRARLRSWARSIEFQKALDVIMTGYYFCSYGEAASHLLYMVWHQSIDCNLMVNYTLAVNAL